MQGPELLAGRDGPLSGLRLRPSVVRRDRDEGVDGGSALFNAGKFGIDQFDGRDFALSDHPCQVHSGSIDQVEIGQDGKTPLGLSD
jgi:hypothetical protein